MTYPHPSEDALNNFVLGKLPDEEAADVERHLAACPGCTTRAATAGPGDTLVGLIASAATWRDPDRVATPTPPPSAAATPSFAPTFGLGSAGSVGGDAGCDPPPVLIDHPRYRPVRLLGVGGMGSVWLAEHAVMGRRVAVKVIRPDLLARPQTAERFVREVRAAARLHHPNLVTAFDAEEADGSCLLVMEYVPGEPLSEVVRAGPLPVADACRAARDAARGLAAAHAAGLVHRDVKPSNLIRTPDGLTKILDFGLVTDDDRLAGLTGENMVVGTPDYIAPEQAEDAHLADARADVYGLGCTLYHLLAGRVPFPGESVLRKLDAHRAAIPDPIPTVPQALHTIVAKMMAKRPDDRFPTAAEVADALEPFVLELEPAAPRARKPRRVLAAVAVGLLALAGLAVGGVVYEVKRGKEVIAVETDDPAVEVVMRRNGELIRIIDTKTNQTWELDTLRMRLTPDGNGLSIDLPGKDPATLRRVDGGKVAVVIRRQADEPAGEVRVFRGHADGLLTVAMSPDGRYAATAGSWPLNADPVIRLWDVRTGEQLKQFQGHTHVVYSVVFSPNGKQLLSVSHDATGRLWDVESGQEVTRLVNSGIGVGFGAVFLKDGKTALTSCERVRLWDLGTGEIRKTFGDVAGDQMRSIDLSPDGKTVAVGETLNVGGPGDVRLWDVATGTTLATLAGHVGLIYAVRFSPDGRRLVSAGGDGTARVWDLTERKEVLSLNHSRPVFAAAFSPGGRYVATGGEDHLVRIWDATAGTEVHRFTGHEHYVWSLVFTPDGRHVLSAGADMTLRMWRLPAALADPPRK
jgi:WD40 repeat protein/tRNA A-37 threonylcarbamoyl transferase component Bud32